VGAEFFSRKISVTESCRNAIVSIVYKYKDWYLFKMKATFESAKKLLDSTKIIELLSRFGEVRVVGSYAFDLMTEPDIDLVVITDTPKESSEEALAYISKLHLFQKLEYGDFQKFPREKRPPFYILNMRTSHDDESWEIEAWFVPDARDKLQFVEMMKNISSSQKQRILDLKRERKNAGIDKKRLSSYEIYRQVLGF